MPPRGSRPSKRRPEIPLSTEGREQMSYPLANEARDGKEEGQYKKRLETESWEVLKTGSFTIFMSLLSTSIDAIRCTWSSKYRLGYPLLIHQKASQVTIEIGRRRCGVVTARERDLRCYDQYKVAGKSPTVFGCVQNQRASSNSRNPLMWPRCKVFSTAGRMRNNTSLDDFLSSTTLTGLCAFRLPFYCLYELSSKALIRPNAVQPPKKIGCFFFFRYVLALILALTSIVLIFTLLDETLPYNQSWTCRIIEWPIS